MDAQAYGSKPSYNKMRTLLNSDLSQIEAMKYKPSQN